MDGNTNSQRNDRSEAISFVAVDGTYANGQKIKWQSNGNSWCTLNNQTDITLKKGSQYLLQYSFTPTTVDGGITGFSTYSNATVWHTGSYVQQIDLRTATSDRTDYLTNNGNSNTFVWFYLIITRLGGA